MIVLAVLEGTLLLLLIFLRQRIRIAIALLKEASKSAPAWGGDGAEDGVQAWNGSAGKVAGSPRGEGQSYTVVNTTM